VICQATIADSKWDSRDSCAPWCNLEAVTTVPLSFGKRLVFVWVCREHYDGYMQDLDLW